MMLMMLAKGASIISIIEGPFLHVWPPMRPMTPHLLVVSQPYPKRGLGLVVKKAVLMMQIWVGTGSATVAPPRKELKL